MIYPEKKHLLIGFGLAMAIIFGFGYKTGQVRETVEMQPVIEPAETKQGEETQSAAVIVHVAGAVERPGIYAFPSGTRINEAIAQAVPLKEAEVSYLNLAEIMTDQQQIIVPRKGQELTGPGTDARAGTPGYAPKTVPAGKVNINTATAAVMEKLPGVGPVTAHKIIDYRVKNGGFKEISELMKVSGIGEKKFSRLKDKVTI